ncbi:MAG: response regulator [bacterium]
MASARLLIVDDRPEVARALSGMLEPRGYVTARAHSITEATSILRDSSFELALIDYRLDDDTSGLTLAALIDRHYPHMGIVIISGYPDLDLTENGFCVADDFVHKGAEAETLFGKLERVLMASARAGTRRQQNPGPEQDQPHLDAWGSGITGSRLLRSVVLGELEYDPAA